MLLERSLEDVPGLVQDEEGSVQDTLVGKTIQEWFLLANHVSNQVLTF